MDYIASRPRVERMGEYGRFTDAGKQAMLKRMKEEMAQHRGAAWIYVVSLRREMPPGKWPARKVTYGIHQHDACREENIGKEKKYREKEPLWEKRS